MSALDAVQATCVIAVPKDLTKPAVLLNTTDEAALEDAMAKLGYAPASYTLGRAQLATVRVLEDWDREPYVAFDVAR